MSGHEWMIVSVVAVLLILVFIALEVLFPVVQGGGHESEDVQEAHKANVAGSPFFH